MPRQPKPYLHQGFYVSEAGNHGKPQKLCRAAAGEAVAKKILHDFLNGIPVPPLDVPTVADVFAEYTRHVEGYYRLPSGKPSSEIRGTRLSLAELLTRFGDLPANQLRREHIEETRQALIGKGYTRRTIDQYTRRIKRAVRWLTLKRLLPSEVWWDVHVLQSLPAWRTPAPESDPVKPVDEATFTATVAVLRDPWKSMALLQWYTGMRPGDAVGLRLSYLDRRGEIWWADFGRDHKMAYKNRPHVVAIGAKGIEILTPWITRATGNRRDHLFWGRLRDKPITVSGYAHTVAKACVRAGVPHWHPNQIRHAFGTRVREKFGLEGAQVALDHAKADVTQVYAERNAAMAAVIARSLG